MRSKNRRASWQRYEDKRRGTELRRLKECARRIIGAMVKAGILVKTKRCECCSRARTRTVFHHVSYSKPRLVYELCLSCHRRHHPRKGLFGGGVK